MWKRVRNSQKYKRLSNIEIFVIESLAMDLKTIIIRRNKKLRCYNLGLTWEISKWKTASTAWKSYLCSEMVKEGKMV